MISVGFNDPRIHNSYICRIKGKAANGTDVAVSGLLSEGYNLQSASNYDQPLLDFSLGGKLANIGAVIQGFTNITTQTISNSLMVYQNESPITMTLPLSFVALRDPVREVSLPIRFLMEMKAPNLREGILESGLEFEKYIEEAKSFMDAFTGGGSVSEKGKKVANALGHRPSVVAAHISRHILFPECLITDLEITDESLNHKTGHALQKTINVTLVFQKTINSTEFAALFPF